MLKRFVAVIAGAIILTSGADFLMMPSFAANDPGSPGTMVAKGECSRLITVGDDYTAKCDPHSASVTRADGTIVFVFSVEGTPVGFSGDGHSVGPAGFGDAMKLPVDLVAIRQDAGIQRLKADGWCVFGNPYAGPASIWCVAITEGGPFVATFKTDGSPPEAKLAE
jgi:hypothetical protein